ncbi:hypothetical protein CPC08DRAFT_712208 [Agrocybe pediades]|nr:hypothetical protein CPC08DRAFT_712208 [Agrocybe pediades]
MPPPVGSELTIKQLIDALRWKLENKHDEKEIEEATKGLDGLAQERYRRQETSWQLANVESISNILGSRANHAQSVNQLPVELLSSIFSMVQSDVADSFPPPPPDQLVSAHSWLKVTRVCRYWRECALNTPYLWRRLVIGKDVRCPGALGTAYIERSSPCTLEITLDTSSTYFSEGSESPNADPIHLYQAIREAQERVGALHLALASQHDPALNLLDLVLPSLYSLQVLFLTVYPFKNDRRGNAQDSFMEKTLPSLYKGNGHQELRRLSLTMAGTWKTPAIALDKLTHLTISARRCNELEISCLFELLAQCPLLVSLDLEISLLWPLIEEDVPDISSPINLPHLKRLKLVDKYGVSSFLLRHLTIPEDTTITLQAASQIFVMQYHRPVHKSQLPPSPYLEKITSLVIRNSPREVIELNRDTFTFDAPFPREFDAAPAIAFPWPLAHVKRIFFDMGDSACFSGSANYFLSSLFRLYDKAEVVEIKASRKNVRDFLKWLDAIDTDHADRVRYDSEKDFQGHVLLPSLSSVIVHVDKTVHDKECERLLSSKSLSEGDSKSGGVVQRKKRPALQSSYTLEIRRG